MILIYPYKKDAPVILAHVEDLLSGTSYVFPMLLDTGADRTCFPAKFATFFGHDNEHKDVKKDDASGVGGKCKCYIHSVGIGLIHPDKPAKPNPVIAWKSKMKEAWFAEALDCECGLIGMDVIKEWSHVTITAFPNGGGEIKISIHQ